MWRRLLWWMRRRERRSRNLPAQPDQALVLFEDQFLLGCVGAVAEREQVEVDLVGVELRAVDAGEYGLAAYGDAAAAAHSGAVDHDRIETGHSLDAPLAREL